MTDKIRAAVIGAGGISQQHIHGYLDTGRYEVVALADLEPGAMQEKNDLFDIAPRHFTDARAMMQEMQPDVVSVCTWHAGHSLWTIAAAAYQPKAILCEKPMADTVGHAEQMLIACERNQVKLAIGHQRRFLPSYILARDMIREGRVGPVHLVQSFGGAGLPNFASHQMDMYRFLLNDDECVWVMGNIERKTDQYERNTRIEDCAVGTFHFRSGAQALILSDVLTHQGAHTYGTDATRPEGQGLNVRPSYYQGARIYGAEGMIDLTTTDLKLLNHETRGVWERHVPDGKFYTVADQGSRFEWVEGGAAQADGVADWVEGAEPYRSTGEDGYKALQMVHAVYESARMHEKVYLPLQTRVNPLDLMVESGHLVPERPGRYDIRARQLRGEKMVTDSE